MLTRQYLPTYDSSIIFQINCSIDIHIEIGRIALSKKWKAINYIKVVDILNALFVILLAEDATETSVCNLSQKSVTSSSSWCCNQPKIDVCPPGNVIFITAASYAVGAAQRAQKASKSFIWHKNKPESCIKQQASGKTLAYQILYTNALAYVCAYP